MKYDSPLALWALAGLCGTALSIPLAQTPYYASRFPQHPQNLGYGGDYPKYWQGEAYNPEVAPGYSGPAAAVAPETERKEQRPSFTDTKYPAREAIKHYSGSGFPGSGPSEDSGNGQNIKITNDTPSDNDKSYTRITKGPGVGLRKKKTTGAAKATEDDAEEPEHRSGGLEDIADLATPRFDGTIPSEEQEEQDGNWGSFTFGVVSDSLVYHDPYENRHDEFERKTDALSKIERMMGNSFVGSSDVVDKRSLGKRDWPEHIQEKALKMMDSAATMQTKGQKTIDNDPQYQASLKGQEAPAPEPAQNAGPKNTFPVGPNSKKAQAAQAPPPPPPPPAPAAPAERTLGSGGGGLVPPHKAGKLAKTKGQDLPALGNPTPPAPQQQEQPSQPMGRQQGNMPNQGKGKTPQRPQGRGPGAQRPRNKAQEKLRSQQEQPNLMKRQIAVPAGPGYPPGTTITRITRPPAPAPVPAAAAAQAQTCGSADGQCQQIYDGQVQAYPISAQEAQAQKAAPFQFATVQQVAPVQQVAQVQRVAPAPVQYIAPVPAPVPAPAPAPAPVYIQQQQQQQQAAAQIAAIPVTREQVQQVGYNAIVHPGQVICPEGKPCPHAAPAFEERERTFLKPVQKVTEVEVTREAVRAVPKLEPVEVTRYVDVEKEVQVEKVVEVCETCVEKQVEVQRPAVIEVCSECREAVGDCSCPGAEGHHESFSKSVSNGEETVSYKSDEGDAYMAGPVSTPGGLEAFFRQRMPEHFGN